MIEYLRMMPSFFWINFICVLCGVASTIIMIVTGAYSDNALIEFISVIAVIYNLKLIATAFRNMKDLHQLIVTHLRLIKKFNNLQKNLNEYFKGEK